MQRTRSIEAAVLLLCVFLSPAAAQNAPRPTDGVFAPFVSRLAAAEKDGKVSLTWTDSRDATGPVIVFRSDRDIAEADIPGLERLAEVPYGAQGFIDQPPRAGRWRYFVAAVDSRGTRYDVVIPYANSVAVGVAQKTAAPVPDTGGPAAEPERRISSVSAAVQGDAVRVSFRAAPSVANVLVYRSAAPLKETRDLLDAVIIQAAPASSAPVVDYPVPGIGYYYALVPEEDLKSGRVSLVPGANATTVPAEVPAGRYRVGLPGPSADIRAMPLPLISLEATAPAVSVGPRPAANPERLSPAAAKAVAELTSGVRPVKPAEKRPRAFPQDLETPAGGEEYALRSIVQGPFAKKDWPEAVRQIVRYLSLSRSPSSEARARYYLGQSYYFSGKYSEALFEFLLAQSQYHAEGQEWIDAVLPRLGPRSAGL